MAADVRSACGDVRFLSSHGLVRECEIELSHMDKNNGNPVLVCQKECFLCGFFCYLRFTVVFICCLVCSLQPCDCLLGKDLTLGPLVYHVFMFVTYQYGVSRQVWYLIVMIPDLCLLAYFAYLFRFLCRNGYRLVSYSQLVFLLYHLTTFVVVSSL